MIEKKLKFLLLFCKKKDFQNGKIEKYVLYIIPHCPCYYIPCFSIYPEISQPYLLDDKKYLSSMIIP